MAETTKLSVEKALEKLRGADAPRHRKARLAEEADPLDDEIKRMSARPLGFADTTTTLCGRHAPPNAVFAKEIWRPLAGAAMSPRVLGTRPQVKRCFQFIESDVGNRFVDSCNCWLFPVP
ncbi:hypothetical protein [Bradyrhizobium sp. LMTR 3]|uniref:hypothetical protein n=1 Tax=Bradyrhizobium sp. LMTR 3 TaxID=189873 RepID=UPI000A0426C5|nr:hypothetical protein [Bradyrhizobium sp. LMTR 3]